MKVQGARQGRGASVRLLCLSAATDGLLSLNRLMKGVVISLSDSSFLAALLLCFELI